MRGGYTTSKQSEEEAARASEASESGVEAPTAACHWTPSAWSAQRSQSAEVYGKFNASKHSSAVVQGYPTGKQSAATATTRVFCATAATLSFSLHPLRAEVVAWCSCQPYTLMTVLLVAAMWTHIRRSENIEAATREHGGYTMGKQSAVAVGASPLSESALAESRATEGLYLGSVLCSSAITAALYLAAVLCKSAAVPAVVFFPAVDAAFFPTLWGIGIGEEEAEEEECGGHRGVGRGEGGGGRDGQKILAKHLVANQRPVSQPHIRREVTGQRHADDQRRGLDLAWRAAAVGYLMLATVALLGIAGAAYGNQSHRENIIPAHNGGEGLHTPQRVALAMRQVLETIGRTLAPDMWWAEASGTSGSFRVTAPSVTDDSLSDRFVHNNTSGPQNSLRGLQTLVREVRSTLSLRARYPLPPAVDPASPRNVATLATITVCALVAAHVALAGKPFVPSHPIRKPSVLSGVYFGRSDLPVSRWSLLLGVYLATLLPATTLIKHGYESCP